MKNSATDRIRAKLADAHPGSDTGDAPEIRDGSAPVSAAVTIDEDYLTSLFGGSPTVDAKADGAATHQSEAAVEEELHSEEGSYASLAEGAVDYETSSYEDAASEPVDYEATEETAASRELLAFHSAIESDVDTVEDEYETGEAEVSEPEAVEDVPTPPAPVVIARKEPVAPPAPEPQTKARVVRIEPVVAQRQPQKNSGKSRSFERNQRQNQPQNNQAAAPPPPVQSRQQMVAPPVNRVPPPTPVAPVVAAPVVAAPIAVETAAAAPNKNRMLMIAAAAVMVVGGGAAMMYKGAAKPETPSAPPQQTSQAAPVAAPANTAPTEPAPTAPAQPAPPPVVAPVEQAKATTPDKSKPAPIETAPQQSAKTQVPDGRAAPKQFVAPTVQSSRPATTNTLVAGAAPEISVNVQGGTIALPSATITGRVAAPPPPPAPAPVATATQTPAAPVAAKANAAPPQMATLTRIKMVPPEYPAAAHNGRISGTVIFSITVGKDGKVASVRPISGNPMLLPAASRAISQWLYTPPTFNGQPTEATTTVQLTFSLN